MLDKFISEKELLTKDELLLRRSFVAIVFVFFWSGVVIQILQITGFSSDPFPSWIVCSISLLLLFINYKFRNQELFVNIFNIVLIGVLLVGCIKTGGIFSYNIKWFIVTLLMSLLFLPKYQFFIWASIFMTIITAFYLINIGPESPMTDFDRSTHFVENIVFVFVVAFLIYVTFLTQDILKKDIITKNESLQNNSKALQRQSGELELLTYKLTESNHKLRDFAHTTSHDLKQPLNTMSAFASLVIKDIEQDKVTAKTKEMLHFIDQSSAKIKDLINSSLDSSKPFNERKYANELLDTNKVLEDVIGRLGFQIDETKASIIYNDLPSLYANQHQIGRVFQNLISNAMKYSKPEIKPAINITGQEDGGKIIFKIEDNGLGIEEQLLEKVFDPYFQSDRDKHIGQGIGLSNCRNIIEALNGKIWAESEFGVYTAIYFSLPLNNGELTHLKKKPLPISSDESSQNSLAPKK